MKFRVFLASVSLVCMTGAALADEHLTPPPATPGVIAPVDTEEELKARKDLWDADTAKLTAGVDGADTPYDVLTNALDLLEDDNPLKAPWTEYAEAVRAASEAGESVADIVAPDLTPAIAGGDEIEAAAAAYEANRTGYQNFKADREFVTGAQADGKTGKPLADFIVGEEGSADSLDRAVLESFDNVDSAIETEKTRNNDQDGLIESNTANITEVVARISTAFEGFNASQVNETLNQVGANTAAIAENAKAIAGNSMRLDSLEEDVDALKGGVAMAIAIANAPIITNGENKFSLSGGLGYYEDAFALSAKGAFMPTNNVAITGSVATDFEGFTAGAGVGIGF